MYDTIRHDETSPRRRLWIAELLLVLGILAMGGFALFSDARVTPSELLAGLSDVIDR